MMHIDNDILQQLGSERAQEVQESLSEYFDDVTIIIPVNNDIKLTSVMFKIKVGEEYIYVTKDIVEGEGTIIQK